MERLVQEGDVGPYIARSRSQSGIRTHRSMSNSKSMINIPDAYCYPSKSLRGSRIIRKNLLSYRPSVKTLNRSGSLNTVYPRPNTVTEALKNKTDKGSYSVFHINDYVRTLTSKTPISSLHRKSSHGINVYFQAQTKHHLLSTNNFTNKHILGLMDQNDPIFAVTEYKKNQKLPYKRSKSPVQPNQSKKETIKLNGQSRLSRTAGSKRVVVSLKSVSNDHNNGRRSVATISEEFDSTEITGWRYSDN